MLHVSIYVKNKRNKKGVTLDGTVYICMEQNGTGTIKLNTEFKLTSVTTLMVRTLAKKMMLVLRLKRFTYIFICVNNKHVKK
jgi:hypothetical protein